MAIQERDNARELTDEEVKRLEKIPEIVEAWEHLRDIQQEYRWAAIDLVEQHGFENRPDMRPVIDRYKPKLKQQREMIRKLVIKNL